MLAHGPLDPEGQIRPNRLQARTKKQQKSKHKHLGLATKGRAQRTAAFSKNRLSSRPAVSTQPLHASSSSMTGATYITFLAAVDAHKQRQKAEAERTERQRQQQRRELTRHSFDHRHSPHSMLSASSRPQHSILRPLNRHSCPSTRQHSSDSGRRSHSSIAGSRPGGCEGAKAAADHSDSKHQLADGAGKAAAAADAAA